MRRLIIGLIVALITFGLGVALTTPWLAWRTLSAQPTRSIATPAPTLAASAPESPATVGPSCGCMRTAEVAGPMLGKNIFPNVLQTKSIHKSQPVYPPLAKAARAEGAVIIQIIADESGRVISSCVVSGHPLLQQAAAEAACQWRFSPTMLSGHPIKVSGNITFNFVLQ